MKWQIEFPRGDAYVIEADCGYEAWYKLSDERQQQHLMTPSFLLCDVQPYDDHDAIHEPSTPAVTEVDNAVPEPDVQQWTFITKTGYGFMLDGPLDRESAYAKARNLFPEIPPLNELDARAQPWPEPEPSIAKAREDALNIAANLMQKLGDAYRRLEEQLAIIEELTRERAELLAENARLRNEQAFAGVIAEQSSTGGVWEGDQDEPSHD